MFASPLSDQLFSL